MSTFTATYEPADNKLRLYASSRLDKELYQRVKSAGFQWAPKQDLFYATWNPAAEDIALELAGEIEDEDKTLVDRAEERSERFEGYQDKRADDAERARSAVSAIADNIPFGQPILVGHSSERRARKDAERIENGMRKAVKLWETSEYWSRRAAGALRHAKYKELPAVRARRIKTIEAELRKQQRGQAESENYLKLWTQEGLTLEHARAIANHCYLIVDKGDGTNNWSAYDVLRPDEDRYSKCPSYTVEQVQAKAQEVYPAQIARNQRWIDHLNHRLAYEKAMLDEQGASALLDKKPKSAKAQLPLVNYRGENGVIIAASHWHHGQLDTLKQVDMTTSEYAAIHADYKGTSMVEGSHRMRTAMVKHGLVAVFITDSKTHPKPEAKAPEPRPANRPSPATVYSQQVKDPRAEEFAKLKELARQGVEVVSSPDLFVTPSALAQRVADVADIQAGHTVLEPSAGTGALLRVAQERGGITTGVEINCKMVDSLNRQFGNVFQGDFLVNCGASLGKFDRVIMNPPFSDQADIKHVMHALTFLKPGGKLVAIMASGVTFRQDRQARDFRNLISGLGGTFEELPVNSFKESGTGVSTVLLQVQSPCETELELS